MTNDPKQHRILLVEDTLSLGEMYKTYLQKHGYDVTFVATGEAALQAVEDDPGYHLVLLDLKLPDMSGLDVFQEFNKRDFKAPVIVITGHGSVNTAVEAMRSGAQDFLVKPFTIERLGNSIRIQLEKHAASNHDNPTKTDAPPSPGTESESDAAQASSSPLLTREVRVVDKNFGGFIGTSAVIQKVYALIENAARSTATVFITGESGTGKELCAEAIHKYSSRKNRPFVPINCAAIPRDLMESELFGHVKGAFTGAIADRDGAAALANGGTLFLDEIGEMDPNMQTKLLRFLQNFAFQKVGGNRLEKTDVRIICATNRDPLEEVSKGRFREDLYYRLYVIPIHMPPLRDRGHDILDLALMLLRRFAEEEKKPFREITPAAESSLLNYRWPGNIRELQNMIRNIVVMHDSEFITPDMLPPHILNYTPEQPVPALDHGHGTGTQTGITARVASPGPLSGRILPLWEIEKNAIEDAIARCAGNIPRAAALLEVSPSTIYRKRALWENGSHDTEDGETELSEGHSGG